MQISTITASDPREDTPVDKLVEFMNEYPDVEVAVQATPSKIAPGMPRNKWFAELFSAVRNNPRPLNLAMHVNMAYCDRMCMGRIPDDLADWFLASRMDGRPVIGRWQINFSGSNTGFLDYYSMAVMMSRFANREFIMQNDSSKSSEAHLARLGRHVAGATFSVLYDASSGNGVTPGHWAAPYPQRRTGYSGGLRPENIATQLDKIAAVAGDESVWIDAEGGLKNPGTKTFDLSRVRAYVAAVNKWRGK